MTQEDKELLLKYLCMALPYGVICKCYHTEFDEWAGTPFVAKYNDTLVNIGVNGYFLAGGFSYEIDEIKPYLCPMSSMTEEEKEEMHNLLSPEGTAIYGYDGISMPMNHYGEFVPYEFMNRIIQYLLEHHFDFMGLIHKDLAIEVTEKNNPYKE